jgi:hypothetical protein
MEIKPCCAGESLLAAAAAIGALPSPASFEKIPPGNNHTHFPPLTE